MSVTELSRSPLHLSGFWNSLPDLVTSAPSVSSVAVFRSQLKTHLSSFSLWFYSACAVTIALDTIIVLDYLLTYLLTADIAIRSRLRNWRTADAVAHPSSRPSGQPREDAGRRQRGWLYDRAAGRALAGQHGRCSIVGSRRWRLTWMSSRQGPWQGHHTDGLCSHGATWLVRRLLNNAKEPDDTKDWGREFQSFTILML